MRGVDIKRPEFSRSAADEFLVLDLRNPEDCKRALTHTSNDSESTFHEVYQLAADMGGMGFIHSAECEIIYNSALINLHMIKEASERRVSRYFFSSSACVYPDMDGGDEFITEAGAYPACPDNEYGWEKLYAERTALAFSRRYDIEVRVARFQNCYGPLGTWQGGREKAPAALCRKVAEVRDGGEIEIWGDGTAMRSYTYVDDLVDGVRRLMDSDQIEPANIGSSEFVSVSDLVDAIEKASGKTFTRKYVAGPVGVQARNHTFEKMEELGWSAKTSLEDGISHTYAWVASQVEAAAA